jgi:hypothetical protein
MTKVESITTAGVQHSRFSSLVEIILLIQEGPLGPYPWRQDPTDPTLRIQKRWATISKIIKRVTKLRDLTEGDLLYLAIQKPDLFHWDKVGLLFWNIDNKAIKPRRFAEVIDSMIKTHRIAEITVKDVPKKAKNLKDLIRRKTNG